MKTIYLSLFILLIAVCLVHTKPGRKKKLSRKGQPKTCQVEKCKRRCQGKPKPERCMKRCDCLDKCKGKSKPKKCSKGCMKADYTVSTDPCLPDPCNGRGTCTGGTCNCNPGWTGTYCDQIERGQFIIGGQDAEPGEWPWQVSLRQKEDDEHFCGAAVISKKWLVTAAHCLQEVKKTSCGFWNFQALLGLHDQNNKANTIRYEIAEVIQHEEFSLNETRGDIAVLRVDGTINLNHPNIAKVTMAPNDNFDYMPTECWLTGWGLTHEATPPDEPSVPAIILQEIQTNIIQQQVCDDAYLADINDGHICFQEATQSKGSCGGDSGGPAVCKRGGIWYLVGVTSFGSPGCTPLIPSVYSRISFFREWIKQKTGI